MDTEQPDERNERVKPDPATSHTPHPAHLPDVDDEQFLAWLRARLEYVQATPDSTEAELLHKLRRIKILGGRRRIAYRTGRRHDGPIAAHAPQQYPPVKPLRRR